MLSAQKKQERDRSEVEKGETVTQTFSRTVDHGWAVTSRGQPERGWADPTSPWFSVWPDGQVPRGTGCPHSKPPSLHG